MSFNIHERSTVDYSSLTSMTNQEILQQTRLIRSQKQAALKIESFYIMCNNKHFLLQMHQIRNLNKHVSVQFWINPTLPNLLSLVQHINIPAHFHAHAFKCGYLLPLVFPKSTILFSLISNNPNDERIHLMMRQIIKFAWLSPELDLFQYLEFTHVLSSKDILVGSPTHNVLSRYDIHLLYKSIVTKRISSSAKILKLQGLFYLCTMLPSEQQNEFAILFTPLLKSLDNIVSLVLCFDNQSILTVSQHFFYKCKPNNLYTNLCAIYSADSIAQLSNILISLGPLQCRQYLFNIFTMLSQYIQNTFDSYLMDQIEGLTNFTKLYFQLIHDHPVFLSNLDEDMADYDLPLLPLITSTCLLIRCALLRLNYSTNDMGYTLFWNPQIKSDLSQLGLQPSLIDVESRELQLLMLNPFYYSFVDRLHMFHIAYPTIQAPAFNLFNHHTPYMYTINRSKILDYLFIVDFEQPIRIQFTDDFGLEEGIDGGGLMHEFMSLLIHKVLSVYFISQGESLLINLDAQPYKLQRDKLPLVMISAHDTMSYIGMLFSRCLRDDIVLPYTINLLINTLIKGCSTINDLFYFDMELYTSYTQLLKSDVSGMNLTWSVTIQNKEYELKDAVVTNETKLSFVLSAIRYIINHYKPYIYKLQQGMNRLTPILWFDPVELGMMMHGRKNGIIDKEDLIGNMVLQGYTNSDTIVIWLYDLIRGWDNQKLCKFMQFVTGRDRPPVLGCGSLNPKIGILKIDTLGLPTSATCMNLLRMPDYKNKEMLREKLEYAIMETKGFGLV